MQYEVLENIEIDHSSVKNRAIALLIRWFQQKGAQATVARLAHALIKAERTDVAEKLTGIMI